MISDLIAGGQDKALARIDQVLRDQQSRKADPGQAPLLQETIDRIEHRNDPNYASLAQLPGVIDRLTAAVNLLANQPPPINITTGGLIGDIENAVIEATRRGAWHQQTIDVRGVTPGPGMSYPVGIPGAPDRGTHR